MMLKKYLLNECIARSHRSGFEWDEKQAWTSFSRKSNNSGTGWVRRSQREEENQGENDSMNSKGKEDFKRKQKTTKCQERKMRIENVPWSMWFTRRGEKYQWLWRMRLKTLLQSVQEEWGNKNREWGHSWVWMWRACRREDGSWQEIMIKGWVLFLVLLMGRIGKCLNAHYQKSAERKRINYRDSKWSLRVICFGQEGHLSYVR